MSFVGLNIEPIIFEEEGAVTPVLLDFYKEFEIYSAAKQSLGFKAGCGADFF